jgi:serine/threonine-protein kinase
MNETIGHYELLRHLATGGMAEIYIARQSGPGGFDRELAIKRILPHLAKEDRFISMFLDEARIASQLRHPNIVQIYELGEADGEYFIAMEYIEGADLADLLDKAEERNIEFPIAMSVRIIADVLSALDYAHEFEENGKPLRIVHRDVSPHNILIGRDGIIKLVDFGIAHAVERHAKTETGLVKGKLSYMAPEQIEQDPVDRRADVFAAGVLLYELLTGQTPFGRELAAVNAILNDDPTEPRRIRPDIPEELVPIVLRSLNKAPEDRYETAQEMLEELEAVLRSFDKYVSPKHVAQFCDRLLNDEPIEGYDDVSQAVPRRLSRQAIAEAEGAQIRTPSGVEETAELPEADPLADTVDGGAAVDLSEDEERPASEEEAEAAEESGEESDSGPASREETGELRSPRKWLVPLGFGFAALVSVGLVLGVLSVDGEDGMASNLDPEVEASPAIPTTIELDAQVLESADAGRSTPDAGFHFSEEEFELAELERWVETLDEEQLEMMIAAHFDRDADEYLWAIRGAELVDQFTGPPEKVDPGDPRAPKLLGLEELDEDVVRKKKRRRPRRRARRKKPGRTKTAHVDTKQQETKPSAAASKKKASPPKKKSRPRRRKKKKKKDLRIIDKAVPY